MINYLNKNNLLLFSVMSLITVAKAANPQAELVAKTRPLSEVESMKTFEIQDDEDGQLSSDIDWQSTFKTMTVDSDNF